MQNASEPSVSKDAISQKDAALANAEAHREAPYTTREHLEDDAKYFQLMLTCE